MACFFCMNNLIHFGGICWPPESASCWSFDCWVEGPAVPSPLILVSSLSDKFCIDALWIVPDNLQFLCSHLDMNIKCNTSQTNPTSQLGDFIISDQVISSNNYTKNNRGALQMETGTPAYRSHWLLPHHDCALCSPSTSCNCNPYESVLALHYEVQYWHWHTVTGPVFLLSPAPAAQGPLPPRQCSITWV